MECIYTSVLLVTYTVPFSFQITTAVYGTPLLSKIKWLAWAQDDKIWVTQYWFHLRVTNNALNLGLGVPGFIALLVYVVLVPLSNIAELAKLQCDFILLFTYHFVKYLLSCLSINNKL